METLIKSQNFRKIEASKEPTIKTGNEHFDKWVSKDGGLVVPSCILLSGDSGSGKTTIMVNLMKWLKNVKTSLYSREMKDSAVKDQTKNVEFDHDNAFVLDYKTCPNFEMYLAELEVLKPKLVIIDSLQAITEQDYPKLSDEDAELYVVSKLRNYADEHNACVILICHNTKDGDYKGSSGIKQYLDAHAVTRYDRNTNTRKIYTEKNRKGPLGELFYEFGENAIVFYTVEEWEIKTQKERSVNKSIMKAIEAYLSTMNKKSENYAIFKKDYNFAVKKLESIQNDAEYVSAVVKLISELSNKYGV